jgi:hypothetical protein
MNVRDSDHDGRELVNVRRYRRRMIFVTVAIAVILALWVWPQVPLFLQVDSCLDTGGRWANELAKCEY